MTTTNNSTPEPEKTQATNWYRIQWNRLADRFQSLADDPRMPEQFRNQMRNNAQECRDNAKQ